MNMNMKSSARISQARLPPGRAVRMFGLESLTRPISPDIARAKIACFDAKAACFDGTSSGGRPSLAALLFLAGALGLGVQRVAAAAINSRHGLGRRRVVLARGRLGSRVGAVEMAAPDDFAA